jgi:hypothetical protein
MEEFEEFKEFKEFKERNQEPEPRNQEACGRIDIGTFCRFMKLLIIPRKRGSAPRGGDPVLKHRVRIDVLIDVIFGYRCRLRVADLGEIRRQLFMDGFH